MNERRRAAGALHLYHDHSLRTAGGHLLWWHLPMVAPALRPVVCSMRGDAAVKAMSHELPRALLDVGRERRAALGGRYQALLAGQQAASRSYRH